MLYKLFKYNTTEFPFKEVVRGVMDVGNLEQAHKDFKFPHKLETKKDQNTILHDRFYKAMR